MSRGRERDLVTNAANVGQVRHAERKEGDRARARVDAVRQQLSTPAGRAFVWHELHRHGLFASIVSLVPFEIYVLAGRRDAGQELHAQALEHPDLYLLMQKEAMDRAAAEQRENAAARTPRARVAGDKDPTL